VVAAEEEEEGAGGEGGGGEEEDEGDPFVSAANSPQVSAQSSPRGGGGGGEDVTVAHLEARLESPPRGGRTPAGATAGACALAYVSRRQHTSAVYSTCAITCRGAPRVAPAGVCGTVLKSRGVGVFERGGCGWMQDAERAVLKKKRSVCAPASLRRMRVDARR
jgi:hypothetical protein